MSELREAAKEALRWMEHARLHLTIKERMHPDGLSLYDSAAEALRAALAQPKTELRDQHKAFTHWYFGLRGINEANFSPEDLAWAAWKAALAQPETEAQTVAWQWRYILPAGPSGWLDRGSEHDWHDVPAEDVAHYANRSDVEVRPLYAHPPRDEWRPASEPPEDLRRRVIAWRSPPQRQSGTWVEALYDDGAWVTRDGIAHDITHWRDVTPPMESPIAAKCQRIEGSGEICGLTPPCPDCGSSLIDVPEGSL